MDLSKGYIIFKSYSPKLTFIASRPEIKFIPKKPTISFHALNGKESC